MEDLFMGIELPKGVKVLEKVIEKSFIEFIKSLMPNVKVKSQSRIDNSMKRIDVYVDNYEDEFLFELKKGKADKEAVKQVYFYKMSARKAMQEGCNKTNMYNPYLFILAEEYDDSAIEMAKKLKVTLLQYELSKNYVFFKVLDFVEEVK